MTWNEGQGPQGPQQPPQQPGYGQPQPGFGHPQTGYGQPQPGFGGPPMGGPTPPKKSNAKWWVLGCFTAFLVFVVIPFVVIVALGIFGIKQVADVVDNYNEDYSAAVAQGDYFVNKLKAGDSAAVYAATTAPYKANNSELATAGYVASIRSDIQSNVYRVEDQSQGYTDGAGYHHLLYSTFEPDNYIRVKLVKEGEFYRVSEFEFTRSRPADFPEDPYSATTTTTTTSQPFRVPSGG